MFESNTNDVVLQRMLDLLSSDIDKREGSIAYDLIAPAAGEISYFYTLLDMVLQEGFASTASGEFLDLRCAELGVYRKKGTTSEGFVTFTALDPALEEGRLIESGTVVATEGEIPLYFMTTQDGVITNGKATVPIVCEIQGVYGNLQAGSIKQVIGDLSGILTVTNEQDLYSGSDDESDESLLDRYMEFVQRPVTSGNENHYLVWAKSIDGIGDARVQSNHTNSSIAVGTVDVIVLDASKLPASETLLDSVKTYIESVRPIGANVIVRGANKVDIAVSCQLVLQSGVSVSDVQPSIENAIVSYLKSLAFSDNTVRYSRIGNAILDTEGVLDYTNLTINGTTSNIVTVFDEVAVLNGVTLS